MTFKLAGITITVEVDNDFIAKHKCIGQALYASQRIILDTEHTPQETTEQSFYHEKVHWILHTMGEIKLRDTEKFVDVFAHLLYQSDVTAKYKEEP
jgi:hypothetical protein